MASIFDRINMKKLRYVGSGSNNVCLTDGTYAIKIGNVSQYEADVMQNAYELGFSVPVYAYAESVEIPEEIMRFLRQYDSYKAYGDSVQTWVFTGIITRKRANVLITKLVKPFMRHDYNYSQNYQDRAYAIATKLRQAYRLATNNTLDWYDDHPWNMGKMDGRLVILDF
jgi:hypothetical protein